MGLKKCMLGYYSTKLENQGEGTAEMHYMVTELPEIHEREHLMDSHFPQSFIRNLTLNCTVYYMS